MFVLCKPELYMLKVETIVDFGFTQKSKEDNE